MSLAYSLNYFLYNDLDAIALGKTVSSYALYENLSYAI